MPGPCVTNPNCWAKSAPVAPGCQALLRCCRRKGHRATGQKKPSEDPSGQSSAETCTFLLSGLHNESSRARITPGGGPRRLGLLANPIRAERRLGTEADANRPILCTNDAAAVAPGTSERCHLAIRRRIRSKRRTRAGSFICTANSPTASSMHCFRLRGERVWLFLVSLTIHAWPYPRLMPDRAAIQKTAAAGRRKARRPSRRRPRPLQPLPSRSVE